MESVGTLMKREIKKNPISILGALLLKSSLRDAKKSIDYSEYGGAPLLGVNGLVLISHGRSSPKAIKNAIRAAIREVEHDILTKIKEEVAK
jgi:glycerol-3-phosphate acyltransferase PlsX